MEEDIKILEEILKDKEWYKIHGGEDIGYREVQAIENLIKGYREKESRYNNLKSRYNGTKEALRVSQELEKHYSVEASELEQQLFDSIPKSKIREKIEELEHIKHTALTDRTVEMMNDKINILELILEDK